jgi:membrane protease YdiL (CAAX protease family)
MQSATEQYLALARRGRNQWWRYVASVLVIMFFAEVLGGIPLLLLARHYDYSGLRAFLALNLGVLVELAGVAIAVVLIHRRSLLSLVTPHARFGWRRAGQGFAVWFALAAASCVAESMLFPGRYRLTFNPDTFFMFAAIALCLTPLQTATEELLFRGYVLQGLGLLVKRPAVIAIASGTIFMLPHLANPEVAYHPLLVPPQYLVIGLLLAAVTLRDGRLELAIGIHTANNLFNGLVANYDDSVLTTDAIFTSSFDPVYSLAALVAASVATYLIFFGRRGGTARLAENR